MRARSYITAQKMEILVIAFLLIFTDAQEIQFKVPENTLSIVGSTVTLKCSAPSRNCSGIDWQKDIRGSYRMTVFKGPGTILDVVDRDRYSVDNSSGCDLIIKNVQLKDAGRFTCSANIYSSYALYSAYLIILETQPKCTINASEGSIVEGDGVQFKCSVTYNGTNRTSMDWKGVTDALDAVTNGTTISRSYSVVAPEPEFQSFTCETSLALETVIDNGVPIIGMATNPIPVATCKTEVIKVFYSVRDVTLSPSLSNYPLGTVITCTARGHPSPTFKWQEKKTDGIWMDIQNACGSIYALTGVSSRRYRCVAMNVVRGSSYNATSHEIQINKTGETASTYYVGIGCGIGILVTIVIAIVINAILVRLGYLEFHPRPANKSLGDIAQHSDHQLHVSVMNRSIPRTGVPLAGEQESAYASLGEDRDANEYASLEQRQKVKPTKKSRP